MKTEDFPKRIIKTIAVKLKMAMRAAQTFVVCQFIETVFKYVRTTRENLM